MISRMQIPLYRCRWDNPLIAASAEEYEPEDCSSGKLAGWLAARRLSKGRRRGESHGRPEGLHYF